MKKFKQKIYTIDEGSYTGPKDLEKIPGSVEIIAKTAGIGAGIGGLAGTLINDRNSVRGEKVGFKSGAQTGAKVGLVTGIAAKLLVNYMHKPMKNIKYQEVDKNIRRQFGVYQVSGIVVGDSLDRRASISEKFGFNDRNVASYKLNFAIHHNKVTMYTFGMTKEELDKTSESLDYYCKKYFSMNYTSRLINKKVNSYAVDIKFTNYDVISQFIMELSEVLNTKINLLDNDAIISTRFKEAAEKDDLVEDNQEEKTFSVSRLNKFELQKLFMGGIVKLPFMIFGNPVVKVASAQSFIADSIRDLNKSEIYGAGHTRGEYNNTFLEKTLKKLHYVEGFHYTVGDENNNVNFSLISGVLLISADEKEASKIDEIQKHLKTLLKRSSVGNGVITYTYTLSKVSDLELILKKFMSLGLKPNLYDPKPKKLKIFSRVDDAIVDKITDKLKQEKIVDFEVEDRIPGDVVSISPIVPSKTRIYLPEDMEEFQYDIESFIRKNMSYIRIVSGYEREFIALTLTGNLTVTQYVKIIKYIIDNQGFCSILTIK